jgi:hypothetical protein
MLTLTTSSQINRSARLAGVNDKGHAELYSVLHLLASGLGFQQGSEQPVAQFASAQDQGISV